MPYKAPNAYARFVKTADTVNSPGATRVMGLIGTGLNYYEVYNEPVTKANDKPYDILSNDNVFEIMSVSKRPVFGGKNTPDNEVYLQGVDADFQLLNGKYIAWKMINSVPEPIKVVGGSQGSESFNNKITVKTIPSYEHFVEDGEWIIEVTYVHDTAGAYRVINNLTKEHLGEFSVSDKPRINVIPGVELTVLSTQVLGKDNEVLTNVGDYITVITNAGKTEGEPVLAIKNESVNLKNAITDLKIVNNELIEDAEFELEIVNIGDEENIIKALSIRSDSIGDYNYGPVVIGLYEDFLDAIPGVNFSLSNVDAIEIGETLTVVTMARVSGAAPIEDSVYYVSYKYRKADEDYAPKLFFDYDDVVKEYGNYDVTASGIVINSLSLGAEVAFTNGVGLIVCAQAKNDSDYEINKAIDSLKRLLPGVNNINTIVPLTESANVGAYAVKHVDLMSSYENGKERMVYIGASRNQAITKAPTALDRSVGMVEVAKSYNNERVVFVVPGEIIKDIRDLRSGQIVERKLPACYAAVAVAALGLVNDPAEPLTNKTIAGFKNLSTLYMESEKNFLAEAGCLVLDQRGSQIKIRHGITTSTASVNSAEITLIQIKDYVIDACRKATAELYVGNKNRPSIIPDVQYTISSILNQFISQDIIIGFSGLSVKRSKDDPREIDVRFEIEAVYPLNYINISFGFAALQ